MSEYVIGGQVERPSSEPDKVEVYRVVRIITKSVTLFQDDKQSYLQTESYIQLKSETGGVFFIVLQQERIPYEGPPSAIRGLEPINFQGGAV